MKSNRLLYQLQLLTRRTKEKGFGLLPTPNSVDWKNFQNDSVKLKEYCKKHQIHLPHIAQLKGLTDAETVTLTEVIMGYPVGWTEITD